jgi:glutamyl-Q tRNA(Asp) synthetase
MTRPVLRFAPSPNGPLHLGHALSALVNHDLAVAMAGRMLLRIEDIDRIRCDARFEAGITADLAWLGVAYETPVRRQSEHFDDYGRALRKLAEMDLIYPAFLSRADVRAAVARATAEGRHHPHDPEGAPLYPGDDRELPADTAAARMAAGEAHAFRLNVDKALARIGKPLTWLEWSGVVGAEPVRVPARPEIWGDVVLARKETPTSYHLSVVVDDALQGVTHVVRGRDLYHATAVHRLLQALLGLPEPIYHHHRLVTDAEGRKLSKSDRDTGLAELRGDKLDVAGVRRLVGLPEPAVSPQP